jgi:hypothetical protein
MSASRPSVGVTRTSVVDAFGVSGVEHFDRGAAVNLQDGEIEPVRQTTKLDRSVIGAEVAFNQGRPPRSGLSFGLAPENRPGGSAELF